MLIILGGLPGTGKTSLARELSRKLHAVYLRIDAIEHGIRTSGYLQGEMNDAGYRAAYFTAAENLALGSTVVADSVNPVALSRDAWLDVAQKAGCPAVEIETICSDKQEHQRRVENRCADLPGFILPCWRDVMNRDYEPWDREHLVVDTAHKSIDACLNEIITWLHAKQNERW